MTTQNGGFDTNIGLIIIFSLPPQGGTPPSLVVRWMKWCNVKTADNGVVLFSREINSVTLDVVKLFTHKGKEGSTPQNGDGRGDKDIM